MRTNSQYFLVLLFSAMVLASCHKSERDQDEETQSIQDALQYITWDNDVLNQLHLVADSSTGLNKVSSSCVTVSLSGSSYPKTLVLDFGNSACTGPDGHSRSGKLIAVFSGKYHDSLTTVNITSQNYYVNGNLLQLHKTLVCKGHNIAGQLVYADYSGDTVMISGGRTISIGGLFTRTFSAGNSTPGNFSDDIFTVSGTVQGRGSRGNTYVCDISEALNSTANSPWYTSGKVKLTPGNLSPRYLNFSVGGGVDSKVQGNLNGNLIDFDLP